MTPNREPSALGDLRRFIQRELGIMMPASKETMLQSRLLPRARALGLDGVGSYAERVLSAAPDDDEVVALLDVVTTNKTDFWREPTHFARVTEQVLPELRAPSTPGRWKAWCAGCSTGEEPYTLAMVLDDWIARRDRPNDFAVLATDVSTRVLVRAQRAIYDAASVEPLPKALRDRYVLRSKQPARREVRIVPRLRQRVAFHRLNFMDQVYAVRDVFDLIFFRNVSIYFDAPTRRAVVDRLCARLRPGGHLFLGQSESLEGKCHGLDHVGPAVYRKRAP